jgi:hypothetical protein
MCDMNLCRDLENGGGNSMEKQSLALSKIMQTQEAQGKTMEHIVKRLGAIPVRSEVREIVKESISVHSDSCANARKTSTPQAQAQTPAKPPEENKVELTVGKVLGFRAQGKLGMVLSALFWIAVGVVGCVAIAHAGELAGWWGQVRTP